MLLFSNIYIISLYLRSLSVLYSPLCDILSAHTFHIPHILLWLSLYTTPVLTGMPHQGCLPHNASMPFTVKHAPDSSSFCYASCSLAICTASSSLIPLSFFCCAFCGITTCAAFLTLFFSIFFHSKHSLYLCLLSLYLKHSTPTTFYCNMKSDRTGAQTQTLIELHQMLYHWAIRLSRVSQCDRIPHSVTFCLLTTLFSTLHCITLLNNTLNLFWETLVPWALSQMVTYYLWWVIWYFKEFKNAKLDK